jgi:alkanesulfonate monooxygenase SsuD/methylene tetrahydromethanopterin reductase-like flavin-dependent oxidoreductase (luciferase family)
MSQRPKVIVNLYPVLPADGEEGRKKARPLGRNRDLYQQVVHEWVDIIKAADDMGVWGASTIEHHLHSEGYEVSPNPGILNAYWAGKGFRNIHIGAMGYVMATQDPIRVAEETAILDHLFRGKYFVGLARGYQSRWTNILGQFSESQATVSDGSAADLKNREIFEERVEMLLECWKNDSVSLDGKYYKAPYPFDTGIDYPAHRIAAAAGGPGEVDANGKVRRVSVVPAPYQRPHPPVFVASSKSDDSIKYCARKGFIPTYFSKFKDVVRQSKLYVEEAASAGLRVSHGERQNIVRWMHVGENDAEVNRKLQDYDVDIYKNFYSPFFPQFSADPNIDWVKNIRESGIFTVGTVEQLRKEWQDMYREVPMEYITLIFHYAQQPAKDVIKELELFMTKVLPTLGDVEPGTGARKTA